MASTAPPILPGRRRVFASVFPPSSLDDFRPAPPATEPAPAPEQTTWDASWRAVTSFLGIPDNGFFLASQISEEEFLRRANRHQTPSKEVMGALEYVTAQGRDELAEAGRQSIIDWYGNEIRRHFLKNFREGLFALLNDPEKDGLLQRIVHCLQLARRIYFAPLMEYILPLLARSEQERVFIKLRREFHMMISYGLPWPKVSGLLAREVTKETVVVLGIDTLNDGDLSETESVDNMEIDRQHSVSYRNWKDEPSADIRVHMMTESEDEQVTGARERLLSLFTGLQLVGFGGEKAQKVFADVMNTMVTEFVRAAYTGQWEGPSLVAEHLRQWIENVFARLVVQVLAIINVPESGAKEEDYLDVNLSDVDKWQDIAIARLGALRTSELFEVIVEWPASSGAIEDLRYFTTYTAARLHLTHSFVAVLNRRLLHPGASTVEILQLYISIIRAFNLLDPKGVLLDRIARPIRRYLRDRDDTVKAIVGGLLADPSEADGHAASGGETLVELSAELTKAHQNSLRNESGELDWDDMNWIPDPVDAAPDYRKSKSSDVIGSLISLFESKETFVKEMQNMLAERLLEKRTEFDQEMSVLELLKVRFGDNALQACEVMLRDIFDSRRVDTVVRRDQGLGTSTSTTKDHDQPDLHAKILSHFFWPDIQEQEFSVPADISQLQQRYSAGFASLKQSRKLTWLNGLGQVTVELDLEDRVFVDEVTTWQATVIHAFNSETDGPISLTVDQLSQTLHMSTPLVRSACLFWVSKRILTESPRDTFRVLEVLPTEDDDAAATGRGTSPTSATDSAEPAHAAAAASAAAAAAAKETAEAAAMEKMNLYWQFIVGMLTNQGAMPLQQIVMMLKIAVPGGFPFSNEELREFLAGMVAKGKLEIVSGGNYRIVQ
ncbi:anaphase-promoting complex subunit ApcB [Aspergillus steynii IBT 23096]|uniref:Anaphase-promoting complex subunit 2 n=1 Tax=Aspergillus steynii IBT 23096 TaxID=1392250 RepID=A0A2I2GS85_9EURO|nr:anaphase-promoting complex subunit ApcB [Aspergillus steynii IBT 23096]PLB55735.1 anaphase-promoting complex subunit ApcB [Aspergillus steynii IBT 23096]